VLPKLYHKQAISHLLDLTPCFDNCHRNSSELTVLPKLYHKQAISHLLDETKTELSIKERKEIRTQMQRIFGITPSSLSLVPATLHNKLGELLTEMVKQAQSLQEWAKMVGCPLPLYLEAGTSLLTELLIIATLARRLPLFLQQANE
jgi:hypothetical protein